MKILLAYKCHPEGAEDPYTSLLPVGLLTLDAVLRAAGHEVTLANLSALGWPELRRLLRRLAPEVVGISQFTHNRAESLRLARLARELLPRCLVVLGGPHASHTPLQTLESSPEVDAVVLGEAERSFPELIEAHLAGRELGEVAGIAWRRGGVPEVTGCRQPIQDLDALPSPAGSPGTGIGVDYRRQLEFVITSRGCPARCLFCSSPVFWGSGVRFRSPRSVVDEIRQVKERFGLVYFSFRDDTFTSDRARVLEICRLLVEERLYILWNCQSRVNAVDQEMLVAMKRAGCECIQFGVESGSPAMLKALGKRITPAEVERAALAVRRAGINLSVYLITGIPGEGEAELRETLRLIRRIRPQDGQVSPLVYYPGTKLFELGVRQGEVSADLFRDERGEGFLVRRDPFVEQARQAILQGLEQASAQGGFTPADFQAQRQFVGHSFVTEMLYAERLELEEDYQGALAVYRSMIGKEPDNPWGHLLLGGLAGRLGQFPAARKAYRSVLELVPRHLPALQALGEIALEQGKAGEAGGWFRRALELQPGDPDAVAGLEAATGRRN